MSTANPTVRGWHSNTSKFQFFPLKQATYSGEQAAPKEFRNIAFKVSYRIGGGDWKERVEYPLTRLKPSQGASGYRPALRQSADSETLGLRVLADVWWKEVAPEKLSRTSLARLAGECDAENWNEKSSERFVRYSFPLVGLTETVGTSATTEGIVAVLRQSRLSRLAERISRLLDLEKEYPDGPALETESLRNMALFLSGQASLPNPEVSISPSGLASCEWQLRRNGVLALEFLSHDMVRYAGVSGTTNDYGQRERVSGMAARKNASGPVTSFLNEELD